MQQEACAKVYQDRIQRGEGYSMFTLGAFGSDLGAVACFFEQPWSHVSSALTEAYHSWLLYQAAVSLRALGRLTEALEPMRASAEMDVKVEEWVGAAISYGNLSDLELTLGQVPGAVEDAKRSIVHANRSGDAAQSMVRRTTHADALHQAGRRAEAQARFREAEALQAKHDPDYPLLYSLRGFQYCDLLLAAPERAAWQRILGGDRDATSSAAPDARAREIQSCREVAQRAAQAIRTAVCNSWLLNIALDHLTLGRVALYGGILEGTSLDPCHASLQQGVGGLRRAGTQDHLPRGLLTRAWLRSLTGARTGPESAQTDLDEAWELAERGPMKLFMADIHLYRARLFFREPHYPWDKNPDGTARGPQDDLAAAEKLINECGYHRRDEELADAKRAILGKGT